MRPITQTLPITVTPELDFDQNAASSLGQSLAMTYAQATPFSIHIVIDDFLPQDLIASICSHFPVEPTSNEMLYERGYKGQHKRQISPNECDPYLKTVFNAFQLCPHVAVSENLQVSKVDTRSLLYRRRAA